MDPSRIDYDLVASIYDQRYKSGNPPGLLEFLRQIIHKVAARRLLEIGCGTGHWLSQIQNCDLRCGLDYSAGMLAEARARSEALMLVQGSANGLPFYRDSFNLIFCVHALHHFENPASFIQDTFRLIKPAGALVVIGMDPHRGEDQWYLYDFFSGTRATDLIRYPSVEQILLWMSESGYIQCQHLTAAYIEHTFVNEAVMNDPILQKNGTSQLSLITEDEFKNGLSRIKKTIQKARAHGDKVLFRTRITLPAIIGFAPS